MKAADRILVYGMTNNRGGMESYIMNIYRNMDKRRLMFDFVIDFSEMAYAEEVLECGSIIHRIPAKGKHPVGHISGFYKLLRQHPEYKIVYFNILNAGAAYSMFAPHILHRRIYVHSHNSAANNMMLHRLFKPLLNGYADKRLACSREAAKFMFNTTQNTIIVNNAIDAEHYAFCRQTRDSKREHLGIVDKKVVITVGRMAEQKNPFFILDVFQALHRKDEKYILLYAAAGALEQEVKTYADKLGIVRHVLFLGERSDIPELLNAADIFFLPSRYEGFGIVLLEAQTSGLRCFTSADVVPAETNVNGLVHFISLDKSPDEWAEEMIRESATELDRTVYADSLKGSGFDIKESVSELTRHLMEG